MSIAQQTGHSRKCGATVGCLIWALAIAGWVALVAALWMQEDAQAGTALVVGRQVGGSGTEVRRGVAPPRIETRVETRVSGAAKPPSVLADATATATATDADPFRRCAVRALAGDFGRLEEWQRDGYARGLRLGVRADRRLVVTQYHGRQADGRIDRRGRRCSSRTAASNLIGENSWVWVQLPHGGATLRQVRDCGASSNDRRAARLGGTWVDLWYPTAAHGLRCGLDGWHPTVGAVVGQPQPRVQTRVSGAAEPPSAPGRCASYGAQTATADGSAVGAVVGR